MAQLHDFRPGVRVQHTDASPTLEGAIGTVAECIQGQYIDTSIPDSPAVWVVWDNPEQKRSLAPHWCEIEFLDVIIEETAK